MCPLKNRVGREDGERIRLCQNLVAHYFKKIIIHVIFNLISLADFTLFIPEWGGGRVEW